MYNTIRFCLSSFISSNYSATFFRYVRNPSKRVSAFKNLKEFKMKTIDDREEFDTSFDLEEMSKRVKDNDLDIEEAFERDEDLEAIVSESGRLYAKQISEEESKKVLTKKKLIGRKYFKTGRETNLLTHAAKEQIKYLHKLNPLDWTPETLSKSFPISVDGVKKLLKCNYTLKDPNKIKNHDEDVRKKWESLMSGKPSDEIYFHTLCLWNAGKLLKENYNGNPNLPKASASSVQNITKIMKKEPIGEYSAIIKNYIQYKNQTPSAQKNNSELVVSSEKEHKSRGSLGDAEDNLEASKFIQKSTVFKEDGDIVVKKKSTMYETELPFSQFKENMKHQLKHDSKKSDTSKQYYQWVEQDSKERKFKNQPQAYYAEEFASKISKHSKENIEMKRDKNRSVYMYNDESGYQLPVGRTIKGKISIPASMKKKKSLFKVKQCVYDENGEFLYKLPG